MAIRVFSEIGRLRRVLVHRPGLEIDRMVPDMMEQLLFDDILSGAVARREHDGFCAVLRRAGVEVLYAGELLAEVLEDEEPRAVLLEHLEVAHEVDREWIVHLESLPPEELAGELVTGIRIADERPGRRRPHYFHLTPAPNYFFQRDPQIVVGDRVLISSMATDAREREPVLARTIFQYHPRLVGDWPLFEINKGRADELDHHVFPYPHLEGGDLLVASETTVMVGVSERTNRRGVEILAEYLRREVTSFRYLLLVELPVRRSYMHLDTVFTFIDRGTCLAHLPVIESKGPEAAQAYLADLESSRLSFSVQPSVRAALDEVGLEVELVPCGGADRIHQEREQWTDGANAFAVAPGVICLYRRNRHTIEELARRGWQVLEEEDVVSGASEIPEAGRAVITIQDHELSRARGGPRCMTMPLEREAL